LIKILNQKPYFDNMKIGRLLNHVFLLFMLTNCGSRKSEVELFSEQVLFNQLQELISSKSFYFSAEAAFPMQSNYIVAVSNALLSPIGSNGVRQQLSSNDDFLKINNDSVSGKLSYFGELRVANYNDSRDANVEFEGYPYYFKIIENEKKKTITVKFKIKSNSEDFNVSLVVFLNKTSKLLVLGSSRTAIRYEGKVKPLKK